jgi:hypothetical protein
MDQSPYGIVIWLPPLNREGRYRSRLARNGGFDGINISLDVGRPSQRCGFIEQPIDSGLFESLLALPLLAFEL